MSDLSSVTVTGIQNNPISSTTPQDQECLQWSATNSQWQPALVGDDAMDKCNW